MGFDSKLASKEQHIPKYNNLFAFASGLIGTLLGAMFLFYFEFKNGDIKVLLSALCGVFAFGLFMLIRGRITGFKELLLMILGVILVFVVYEIFIDMLYMYEAGIAGTLENFSSYIGSVSSRIKIIVNNLLRIIPAILVLFIGSIIFVDPIIGQKN